MNDCYHSKYILNNKVESRDSFNENYLFKGISPYEVLKVLDGVPLFFEDHFERLQNTLKSKNLQLCYVDNLKNNILKLEDINEVYDGNIKILFNIYNSKENCLVYFLKHYYPTKEQYTNGIAAGIYQTIRENPNAKLINKSLITSAKREKNNKGVYEVLLSNNDGYITEGSMSNVFFIKGSTVFTPPLESVLPGITRKYIITTCLNLGIPLVEKAISQEDLKEFDSVFLSSTSINALPVSEIEELSFDTKNPTLLSIMKEFDNIIMNYITNFKI